MHFVMALLLCYGLLTFIGVPTATSAEITSLRSFSNAAAPAQHAGLKAGDVLVAIDGHRYSNPRDFVPAIQDSANTAVTVTVRRDHHLVTLKMTPLDGRKVFVGTGSNAVRLDPLNGPAVGVVGVELNYATANVKANPLSGIPRSATLLGSLTKATVLGIGQVFSLHSLGSFVHQVATAANTKQTSSSSAVSSSQFVSIVGAVQIGAQAARQNIAELLLILIGINLFVGLVNLFPMLPLDGGHVVIAIYERIRSRKNRRYHADVTKLMPVAYVFLIALLLLGLGALYLNILHPVTLPHG
jgi:membrane-associated protease RseP (regulator of RpoE activity)